MFSFGAAVLAGLPRSISSSKASRLVLLTAMCSPVRPALVLASTEHLQLKQTRQMDGKMTQHGDILQNLY